MRRLISRTLLVLFVALALGVLAFGPRPKSPASDGRVVVQYWEKWTGREGQQMQEIVDEFNDTVGRDKGIFVEMNSMSQIDRKTIVSTAAGAPPDVVGMWDAQVMQFASLGALEPLDAYAGRHGIRRDEFKKVYIDGCTSGDTLYALPSTVWCVAMLWNKQVFADRAAELRAAGCDPTRPPRTIAELDRYAAALDVWDGKQLSRAGYVPSEPGSFTNVYGFWFGANFIDDTGTRLQLASPELKRTYDWFRGYSERLGVDRIAEFRSGFSNGLSSISDTPQNPFFLGLIAMEQQGPWVTAQLEKFAPDAMRWGVPAVERQRERDVERIAVGASEAEVRVMLGVGVRDGGIERWSAGVKTIEIDFADGKVSRVAAPLKPARERQQYCQWGAVAFPAADPNVRDVTYAGMDVWSIPSTAKHKEEAFTFIAFATRQKQIEKLASLHCNLSPRTVQSESYRSTHPNPYVDVYEDLAASPNARPVPKIVNLPIVQGELTQVAEKSALLLGTTEEILARAQRRSQKSLDAALAAPDAAKRGAGKAEAP